MKLDISEFTRKHALQVLDYCVDNLGESHYVDEVPRLIFWTTGPVKNYLFPKGYYCSENNIIWIYKSEHKSALDIIDTIIHEYTHYLQNLDEYGVMFKVYNYKTHPMEIEARQTAKAHKFICRRFIVKNLAKPK